VTTQTVQSAGPVVMPRVNLMPPEIADAERLRRVQIGMVGAVVASALLVGGLYYHAKQGMNSAQNSLTAAQQQNSVLQAKYTSLAYVQAPFTEVQAKRQLLQEAMGDEIDWSFILNDLTTAVPNNVWFNGLTTSETTVPAVTTAVPTVGADGSTTGVGTITFTGVGAQHDDVANWLVAMTKVKGFADPSFQSSAKGVIGTKIVVDWSGQAVLSQKALSGRYTDKTGS
jgi:Tfp pilus assembly protein PilN